MNNEQRAQFRKSDFDSCWNRLFNVPYLHRKQEAKGVWVPDAEDNALAVCISSDIEAGLPNAVAPLRQQQSIWREACQLQHSLIVGLFRCAPSCAEIQSVDLRPSTWAW